MKNKSKYILLSLLSLSFISCASNRAIRDKVQASFVDNDYEKAISYLQDENTDRDLIDLNLDEAMLLFLNGQYKESSHLFNTTGYDMAMYTGEMSVGQMIQAGLISEESIKYVGPAYEYSLIDIMNAFNFMMLDDYDNARAMMRRSFNNNKNAFNELKAKLKQFETESGNAFNSSTQKAINEMADEGLYYDLNSLSSDNINKEIEEYGLSPFIFYLGSALFANNGEMDLATDWMRNIKHSISPSLSQSIINIPEGMGSLSVVTLSDTILKREEEERSFVMLRDLYGLMVTFKLTWPVAPKPYNIVKNIKVNVYEQEAKKDDFKKGQLITSRYCELIEDFDEDVIQDVASKSEGAFARSLIRNITRKTASYLTSIAAVETAKKYVDEGGTIELIAYYAALATANSAMYALDSTEHADTRQCVFFPSKASAAAFILEPGTYVVEVNYIDNRGKVILTDNIYNCVVEEGRPSVIPSEYINTGNLKLNEQ